MIKIRFCNIGNKKTILSFLLKLYFFLINSFFIVVIFQMNTMNSFLENKTAMEIYYIRKQLPESATIPKPEQFKKTYAFYGDDDNIWNKPARTSKKMYQFYQKYNDENQKNLTHRQEMIFFDRIKLQERKKNLIICEREESKSRMSTRKLERKILQYESYQKLDGKCENDEELKKTLKNKELSENLLNKKIQLSLNGRVPNLWNDLNKSSMKSIKMECTMPVLQKDEEAIIAIQNKIYKSQELERVRKEFLKETRETTRSKFLQKHNENFEFQKKVGLVNETIIDNGMFKTKFINLKSPNNQKNVHIDKLSHPKSVYSFFYIFLYFSGIKIRSIYLQTC